MILYQMAKSYQYEVSNLRIELSKLETAHLQLKESGAADLATYAEKLKALNAK